MEEKTQTNKKTKTKQKNKPNPDLKKQKTKENREKPSWSQTSIPRLLKVSLGKIICPNPNTESSIVHSC